jgi:hypothetical protein
MAREGVPLIVIQRQLGHSNLGITSVYLQGIDSAEIIQTVHAACPDDPGQHTIRDGRHATLTSRTPAPDRQRRDAPTPVRVARRRLLSARPLVARGSGSRPDRRRPTTARQRFAFVYRCLTASSSRPASIATAACAFA